MMGEKMHLCVSSDAIEKSFCLEPVKQLHIACDAGEFRLYMQDGHLVLHTTGGSLHIRPSLGNEIRLKESYE